MILLDTHAWIWMASAPHRLSDVARRALDGARAIGVSPISCWEIATKASRGRLRLDRPVDMWVRHALALDRVCVAELSPEIAVAAGRLGQAGFHGDPADRILAATAMHHGVSLLTCDDRIRSFPSVSTIW